MAFADQLVYSGYDDWRLPSMDNVNPACYLGCPETELGHLFYVELGNCCPSSTNTGPFFNLTDYPYWSRTESGPTGAWTFTLASPPGGGAATAGIQDVWGKERITLAAWPVRDGDVRRVPEPASVWLLAVGFFSVVINHYFGRGPIKLALLLITGLLTVGPSVGTARATLIDRGYGLIYDTDLNITWMQDAAYFVTLGNVPGDLGGRLWWDDATAWVDTLIYAGYDDWRLPTTVQPDPTCSFQRSNGISLGFGCSGSELGHLFYIELMNPTEGGGPVNTGPFINVGEQWYWSSTAVPPEFCEDCVYAFYFGGEQDTWTKQVGFSAWPVRDGKVSEPASLVLLSAGLLGGGIWRRVRAAGAQKPGSA
jgi:hypothetical protein